MKLSELAATLKLGHKGPDMEVTGVSTLDKAGPSEITFLANPKYVPALATTKAGCVIVDEEHSDQVDCALISSNVYFDLARVMTIFSKPQGELTGINPEAHIDPSATVDETAVVYPFAFVGPRSVVGPKTRIFPGCYVGEDTVIGEGCTLYPNVCLMSGTVVGDNVAIHCGAVIGADGFGYAFTPMGPQKIPQIGRVVIGDNVEIGANTTIDRAALDRTVIGEGTKLDNLVMIAHNVEVGKNCVFVSQVGVAGSTKVGDNVTLAGQVGIADNISIGSNVRVAAGAGVAKNLPDGFEGGGTPVMERSIFLRALTGITKLPKLMKRISDLEKRLARIEGQGDSRK